MAKSLGRLVRDIREEAGISRAALARASNLTAPEVSRIELEARTNVRFSTVCRIATALGVSLDDLAARAGLVKAKILPRARVEASIATLLTKLDAVESTLSRAGREVARVKEDLNL